jgi:hypothetical protein
MAPTPTHCPLIDITREDGIRNTCRNFEEISTFSRRLLRRNDTSRKVVGSSPDEALGFTQPLTEMSTRSRKIVFLGSRAGPVRRADKLIAICEPIV